VHDIKLAFHCLLDAGKRHEKRTLLFIHNITRRMTINIIVPALLVPKYNGDNELRYRWMPAHRVDCITGKEY
jgi:hypothetical protein